MTGLVVVTFAALLFIQIIYMRSMIQMREDQFNEGVRRSLYNVTSILEQKETRHFLEEDVNLIEVPVKIGTTANAIEGITYQFTTPDGVKGDLTLKGSDRQLSELSSGGRVINHYSSIQEKLKDQYLYQRGLIDEVILNIISQSSNRPIYERADSSVVDELLHNELSNNGIDLPFEFAITNHSGVIQYKSRGYTTIRNTSRDGDKAIFVQTLFPSDAINKRNYLRVYFPDKKDYIFSAVRYMIPSLTFTGLLLLTFVFVIIMMFRQKRLSEMKNDFINNMTHEFKTPISSISLAAQMLNDDTILKSPAIKEHIATVINDETKRLRFQVEKVLQMSLFDRSKATIRLQEIDANAAINSIVNTFKLKVERYGGKISSHLDAINAIVNVDEMHFTNVIFNLLDNAVKYRKEDEPLNLTVCTRDIPNERIEIVISDNGIGIKKEDLKKIFEKFYRVSTGNRHDVKGFGLGLAYVKKMILVLGGDIKVESEPGQGTKFIITLPLLKL